MVLIRPVAILAIDAAISITSLVLALLLRFDGRIEPAYLAALPAQGAALVLARVGINWLLRLHRWSFRYSGLPDGARVAAAALGGTGVFVLVLTLSRTLLPPRSVVVLEGLASLAGMVALRFGPRLGWTFVMQSRRRLKGQAVPTLIIGAGAAGEMLHRDLQRSDDHNYRVVGFIDDDRSKWNNIVSGRPVLGGLNDLRGVLQQHGIATLLVAVPRASSAVVRRVMDQCEGLNVHIKALPVSYIFFRERGPASLLQDVTPEDLLPRQAVEFADHERSELAGRRVLVTGAAGSIGSELVSQLVRLGVRRVLGADINENGLYLLQQKLRTAAGDRLTVAVVDIRDQPGVEHLVRQFMPHDVFHAAAHKHVPLMEAAPSEAVKNNIGGTSHVLLAAERLGAERFVFISSDKAVAPTTVMGATKRIGELMTRAVAQRSSMRACAVRFGNVLGSEGSVVPLFRQQIEAGGPVTITHPDMRRYFMTIPEAAGLVLKAAYAHTHELCVLDMGEPIRILDLAHQMITLAGLVPNVDIPIVVTGLRPGEKLNEELLMAEEEVVETMAGKIQIIAGPPPPATLWAEVAALQSAAAAEDTDRVWRLLRGLAPTLAPASPAQG